MLEAVYKESVESYVDLRCPALIDNRTIENGEEGELSSFS